MKKRLGIIMTMVLLIAACTLIPAQAVAAKEKVKISATKKTLKVGSSYNISLKNAGTVKWKSSKKQSSILHRTYY